MAARRAFELKEQQCSAKLQALRLRSKGRQLRAVHSVVASMDQAVKISSSVVGAKNDKQ